MRSINAQEARALVEKFKLMEKALEPIYEWIRQTAVIGKRTVTHYSGEENKNLLADRLRADGYEVKIGSYDSQMGWPLVISW